MRSFRRNFFTLGRAGYAAIDRRDSLRKTDLAADGLRLPGIVGINGTRDRGRPGARSTARHLTLQSAAMVNRLLGDGPRSVKRRARSPAAARAGPGVQSRLAGSSEGVDAGARGSSSFHLELAKSEPESSTPKVVGCCSARRAACVETASTPGKQHPPHCCGAVACEELVEFTPARLRRPAP